VTADADTCAALLRALRELKASTRRLAQDLSDVPVADGAILAVLATDGDQRVTDLAHRLRIDESSVSRRTTALVGDGAVVRVADPADGRAHLLQLTAAGRDRWAATQRRVTDALAVRLQDWDGDELDRVAADLRRLAADVARPVRAPA